jgi:hypothetical protein
MAAGDEKRTLQMVERLLEGVEGIIALGRFVSPFNRCWHPLRLNCGHNRALYCLVLSPFPLPYQSCTRGKTVST